MLANALSCWYGERELPNTFVDIARAGFADGGGTSSDASAGDFFFFDAPEGEGDCTSLDACAGDFIVGDAPAEDGIVGDKSPRGVSSITGSSI